MANRIIQRKLLLYHHLLTLGEDTLAHQVAELQLKLGYPGLMTECSKLVTELKLPDITAVCLTKQQWKRLVKGRLIDKNKDDILSKVTEGGYKKIDKNNLAEDKFSIKPYFKELSMQDARLYFQSQCKMLSKVKMNFKNNPSYSKVQWKCSGCSKIDSQEHLLWCPRFAHLRIDKNLDTNSDLVKYYRQIINLRED